MRIISLEVDNHPVLGTFSYSFDEDRAITLLVGKNGSGKTKFIEFIHELLDKSFRVWEIPEWNNGPISRIKLLMLFERDELENIEDFEYKGRKITQSFSSGNICFEASNKTQSSNDIEVYIADDTGKSYEKLSNEFKKSLLNGKPFAKVLRDKTRYSGVRINFGYNPVTSFSEKPDDDNNIQTKSTENLADEINRLLVATYYNDRAIASEKYEVGEIDPRYEKYKGNFDRFKDAYDQLFETKKIVRVESSGKDNVIVIKDTSSGTEFGIDGLSSGEQQVVYRAGYLLRHLNIKNGGVVFIDEPELSLHPEWQINYLQFLQNIFGENIQFIIATHSPYLAKSAGLLGNVAISRLYNDGRNLSDEQLHKMTKLGNASYAEVSYKVFKVSAEEYHRELYLAMTAKLQVGEMPSQIDKHLMQDPAIPTVTTTYGTETLMSFVRNIYHHGNDAITKRGRDYTPQELENSILEMEKIL